MWHTSAAYVSGSGRWGMRRVLDCTKASRCSYGCAVRAREHRVRLMGPREGRDRDRDRFGLRLGLRLGLGRGRGLGLRWAGARLVPHLVALHVALSGPTWPPAAGGGVRWEQREWRVARLLPAMALVRLSDSGLLDLDLLRTRPSYRAVLLHDLVPLPCMAAAEMEGEEDEAAHPSFSTRQQVWRKPGNAFTLAKTPAAAGAASVAQQRLPGRPARLDSSRLPRQPRRCRPHLNSAPPTHEPIAAAPACATLPPPPAPAPPTRTRPTARLLTLPARLASAD